MECHCLLQYLVLDQSKWIVGELQRQNNVLSVSTKKLVKADRKSLLKFS